MISKRSLNYSTIEDNNSPKLFLNAYNHNYNSHSFLPPIQNNLHTQPLTEKDLY
jgi:hypothetical protein